SCTSRRTNHATNRSTIGSPTRNQKPEAINQRPEANPNTTPSDSDESSGVKPPGRARCALPDWLPADTWRAFEEHRKALRKPISDAAMERILRELDEQRQLGQNPTAMLDQSIANGWTGVFPVKKNGTSGVGVNRQAALEERNAEVARRWLEREQAKD